MPCNVSPVSQLLKSLLQFARECVGMSCPANMDKAQTCIKCQNLFWRYWDCFIFRLVEREAFFGATIDTPETWLSLSCSRKSLALTTSILHVPTHKAHQSSKEKSWTYVNLYQFSSQNSRAPNLLAEALCLPKVQWVRKMLRHQDPIAIKVDFPA